MKATTFALALLAASTVVSACANKPAELSATLERAESIMYANPDSALLLLNEMPASEVSATPLNHATWCLLTTQARYKKSQEQSDSLLNIAHAYFMAQDNPQRKALSLYLLGGLSEEKKENDKAIHYYTQAAEWVDKTSDYPLGYLIWSHLGSIYIYSKLDYAEGALQQAYQYAKKSGKGRLVANALALQARYATTHHDWQASIRYYTEAIDAVRHLRDTFRLSAYLMEVVSSYGNIGDEEAIIKTSREAFALGKNYPMIETQLYSLMAKVYSSIGQNDSAQYYVNKSITSSNIYTKRAGYHTQYMLARKAKDFPLLVESVENLRLLNDSIHKQERAHQLIEMKEKYDEQKIILEKEQLKIEKDRTIWMVIGILALVLFVATYIIYWYQRRLLQKGRTIKQYEDTIRAHQLQIYENKAVIAQNESRIQELLLAIDNEEEDVIRDIRLQNETLQAENVTLQKEINKYVSTLTEKSKELLLLEHLSQENGYLRERTHLLSNRLIKRIETLHEFTTSPHKLDAAGWKELQNGMNEAYDDFVIRLTLLVPNLTASEVKLCCLIKLRLSVATMAKVLVIEPESVSRQKLRLKEHIAKKIGDVFTKENTFDMWLWNF